MIKLDKSEVERHWIAWGEGVLHWGTTEVGSQVDSGQPNFYKTVDYSQFEAKFLELGGTLEMLQEEVEEEEVFEEPTISE